MSSDMPLATPAAVLHKNRINSIDMMRGIVILLMLLDHVRERFFLHMQVSDPIDLTTTDASLFFSRFAAHFCAPVFIFLTGLSAWLYAHPGSGQPRSAREFLIKRGIFLIVLEVTLITFSWMGSYHTIWLQVMWAIGLSMLALAVLINMPRHWMLLTGLLLVCGHNLLTPVSFTYGDWGYSLWTILHDRGYLLPDGLVKIKVSYPVLPWIGVILLGYVAGPLYAATVSPETRKQRLLLLGAACLLAFIILRGLNLYGETDDWSIQQNIVQTGMSILNLTKYPPSLSFLLITLGGMFIGLSLLERTRWQGANVLSVYGSVPMFFYILHLYVLLVLYQAALWYFGANHGALYGVPHIGWIWLIALLLAIVLYPPVKAFAAFKRKSKNTLIKYL